MAPTIPPVEDSATATVKAPALARADRAQDRDHQLAREDHDHDPCRDQALLDQDDEDGEHEELVRERIEKLPEIADAPAAPGQLSVESVGERENDEQRGGDLVMAGKTQKEKRHQQWDGDQPADGQAVGDVHDGTYGEVCDENSRVATPAPIGPRARLGGLPASRMRRTSSSLSSP